MTAMALIVGFGIGWLVCAIIMKRAHKTRLNVQRRLYTNHYDKENRQEFKKTSKNKNQ